MNKEQEIYIYMDDSGRMSHVDKCCSYGGVYFKNRNSRDNFKRHYVDIIKKSKCHFCNQIKDNCDKICPEIKSYTTDTKFRRRIVNLISKSSNANCYATTVYTRDISSDVLSVKYSRGRRTDYYQKRVIKEIVNKLIIDGDIDPYKKVKIVIRIDQSPRASNGMYDLESSIIEELVYGITNFDYGRVFPPILFGGLNLDLKYVDSKKRSLGSSFGFFGWLCKCYFNLET